jgi:hypothetical protein
LNDRGFVLRGIGGLTGFIALLIAAVVHPHYFIAGHDSGTLVIAWLLLVIIFLAAPRLVFNLVQGFRGVPVLRLGDEGIWSRRWPRLGWIKWADVAAVVIVSGGPEKSKVRELRIELRRREYALLPCNDKVAQLFVWLLGTLFGFRLAPRELGLVSNKSLTGSWDDLMAALEPVLLRNGVWKREERNN